MAQTLKMLAQDSLSTSSKSIYTVPPNTITIVKEIIFCNQTLSGATLTLYVIQSGDTVAPKNTVIKNMSLIGTETQIFGMSTFLNPGTSIQALSDTEGAISITISGVEIS